MALNSGIADLVAVFDSAGAEAVLWHVDSSVNPPTPGRLTGAWVLSQDGTRDDELRALLRQRPVLAVSGSEPNLDELRRRLDVPIGFIDAEALRDLVLNAMSLAVGTAADREMAIGSVPSAEPLDAANKTARTLALARWVEGVASAWAFTQRGKSAVAYPGLPPGPQPLPVGLVLSER